VKHSQADISKAQEVIGFVPLVDFQTGLAETVSWYRQRITANVPKGA
jgi:nucleoside-diphosphate-sugar epimerase